MRTFISILSFALLGHFNLNATAQYPDKIIYEDKEYMLHSNPLEAYFELYPEKRPKPKIAITSLWRGYVATFIVKNDELYLKDIKIMTGGSLKNKVWKSVLRKVFPGKKEVRVGWVTGILVIPHGKQLNYTHSGYASIYSYYILLETVKGKVTDVKRFEHDDYILFKDKQFRAFKQTEEYRQIVKELKADGGYDDDFIDSFLRNFVIDYSSKFIAN
ncbi:MAG: hypothetical protein HRU41_08300 [Saprospiraceae bacterium]|nr:hypothetical protein [Saprospiraceae bacterium]